MNYISLLVKIKEENENRLIIQNEKVINNECFVEAYLKPKDINICPQCGSSTSINFGKKNRCFQDEYYANCKTFVSLTYHRFKCKACGKIFVDRIPGLDDRQSIAMNLKLNILEDLKKDVSFTTVAEIRHVSI